MRTYITCKGERTKMLGGLHTCMRQRSQTVANQIAVRSLGSTIVSWSMAALYIGDDQEEHQSQHPIWSLVNYRGRNNHRKRSQGV